MGRSSAGWRVGVLVVVAGGLSFVTAGRASARTPTTEVQAILAEASHALADPATQSSPEEQVRALVGLLERVVAFPEAAELALGSEWRARSAAERAEFLSLFIDMVERSFVMTVASRAKVDGGLNVRYLSEWVRGDHSTVRVTMTGRDDRPIPVEFRMVRRGAGWAIRDLAIDGISFMHAFRAQFRRIMRDSSYEDLVARMKARNVDVPAWWAAARPGGRRAPSEVARVDGPAPGGSSRAAPAPASDRSAAPVAPPAAPRPVAVPVSIGSERQPSTPTAAHASGPQEQKPASIYWVQIGLYENRESAIRLLEEMLVRKLPVDIGPMRLRTARGELGVTRVRVGPYAERKAAAAALADLKRAGYSPILGPDVTGPTAPRR